jgi:cAMP-specific phosphodiesterase 4
MLTLATKTSLMSISLVLVVPLFGIGMYPEDDLSMRLWGQKLEADFERAVVVATTPCDASASTIVFKQSAETLNSFYDSVNYFPFRIEGFSSVVSMNQCSVTIPGADIVNSEVPVRKYNIVRQYVPKCRVDRDGCNSQSTAAIFYNFTYYSQWEAAMDMLLIFFITIFMVGMAFDLSKTLDRLVVKPLTRLLQTVKKISSSINSHVKLMSVLEEEECDDDDDDDDDEACANEAEMLEKAFEKFAKIAALSTRPRDNVASMQDWDDMTHEGKGVMADMMNVTVRPRGRKNSATENKRRSVTHAGKRIPSAMVKRDSKVSTDESHANLPNLVPPRSPRPDAETGNEYPSEIANGGTTPIPTPRTNKDTFPEGADAPTVTVLPVSKSIIESWDFDVLDLEVDGLDKVVCYIFFDSAYGELAGHSWTQVSTFQRFLKEVREGYTDLPYHCYAHACDVLHTVFRFLTLVESATWLSDIEQHALLVAAICHDVGHRGRTNPFLVETRHELAMRYNDKSPLENMHCAKLFEICGQAECDVFEMADKDSRKQARKVCIASILHTDNVLHFEMVNEISKVYELASDICDNQAKKSLGLIEEYEEVLNVHALLFLELFLHLADVSNPLKPFKMCRLWAGRVLDEFFAQGDEEKALGIPVGMLNDRDVVNRPGSQFDFINFLVTPLVVGAVKVFPPFHVLTTQMAKNSEEWRNIWVQEKSPPEEDVAKRDGMLQKIKHTAEELRSRRIS